MMYIEIDSKVVHEETSNNGNQLRSQQVYMWRVGEKYPQPFKVGLGSAPPWEPGKYLFGARTFRPSRYGNFEMDTYNIELIQLKPEQAKALGI